MADLIDRQKIKARLEPWLKVTDYSEGELNMLKAVLYEITIMPSAQPERCEDCVNFSKTRLLIPQADVPDTNVGDMISRQAAIDALINELNTKPSYYWDNGLNQYDVEPTLKALPSADAQPVRHGKWVKLYTDNYKCSECGDWWGSDDNDMVSEFRYCPYCGARMDGKQDG